MKVAAVLVLLAGCLSKPGAPNPVQDAAVDGEAACVPPTSDTGLMTTMTSTPTVTWPRGMQLQFADPTQTIAMPTFLSLGGANVLAEPQSAQCETEDQAGVAVFPAFSASGSSQRSDYTLSTLDRDVVGPAYTQLTVHWARTFTCGTVTSTAAGNTRFSFFPDGRLIRNDTITPSSVATTIATSCDCTGAMPPDFYVTSYLALRREAFALFSRPGFAEVSVPGPMPDLRGASAGCLVEAGATPGRIAIGWEPGAPIASRIRSVGLSGSSAVFAFVYDFAVVPGLLATTTYGHRTTMVMSDDAASSCAALMQATATAWPPVSIGPVGGALGIVNSTDQRVHVDATEHTGPIEVRATAGDVPAGLVISVRLPGSGITTSRADGVIWQREADGRYLVWFRDGLPAGQSITITPAC